MARIGPTKPAEAVYPDGFGGTDQALGKAARENANPTQQVFATSQVFANLLARPNLLARLGSLR
ncbi:MAG TPA: hypothetical protein VHX12_09495 [Acidisoma sp.]|nr:hypothetical protein [Acidisoma sp.]